MAFKVVFIFIFSFTSLKSMIMDTYWKSSEHDMYKTYTDNDTAVL